MIKKSGLGLITLIIFLFLSPFSSFAQAPATPTPATPASAAPATATGGGGSCDWDAFRQRLGGSESGNRYNAVNTLGYIGRYQFGEAALNGLGLYSDPNIARSGANQDFSGTFTGEMASRFNVRTRADFLANGAAQDRAFDLFMDANHRNTAACHQYIGRQITSRRHGTCTVTMSGILGGAHLGGPGSVSRGTGTCGFLATGNDRCDAYGTCISDYICRFSGFNTPYDSGGTAGACSGGAGSGAGSGGAWNVAEPNQAGNHFERLSESLKAYWVGGLMLMAEQFSVSMMNQVQSIGLFLDAKHQLETLRIQQQRAAVAHKDYHPSEQMCTFGTFARDLGATERRAHLTRAVVSQKMIDRETHAGDTMGRSNVSDSMSRLKKFREKFCDPEDNGSGLKLLCPNPPPANMRNRDIDFTRTLDQPLTLDVNFTDTTVTDDEEAILALVDNLFMHDPTPDIPESNLDQTRFRYQYMNMRSIIAMRGVARNSISNLIALKSASPENAGSNAPYLKALMRDMGLNPQEIDEFLGKNPSYHAQMELLTKKLYQTPAFYTALYDKPANVERIRTAMRAIKVMHDRDIHAAMLRREMLLSMILEMRLRQKAQEVYNETERALYQRN
jgi:hypothetical protein